MHRPEHAESKRIGGTGRDALLQLAALVSELAHLGEEDADLAREGLAKVVQVPISAPRTREPSSVRVLQAATRVPRRAAYFGGAG